MGTKVTVDSIPNLQLGSAIDKIDGNFVKVSNEFDKVLYKDGSAPLTGPLDANSNRIINATAAIGDNDLATLGQVKTIATNTTVGPKGDKGDKGDTGNNGYISQDTWAHLAAITGASNGATAQVLGPDAGTHTDPVVGGIVANTGTYSWSTSPVGWKRLASLTTSSGGVGDNIQVFDMRSFVWGGVTYSFRSDGVQVDEAAVQALRDLLLNCTAPKVEIVFPAGTFNFGDRYHLTAAIQVQRSNVTIRGAGKHATLIRFQSAYTVVPTTMVGGKATFDGFGIVVASQGVSVWTRLSNVTLVDFELECFSPNSAESPDYVTTNACDGIFAYFCDNILLDNIRTTNCKGNGHITVNGMTDSDGPINHDATFINCDLVNDPTRLSATGTPGFGEGDGYNIGSYTNVKIIGGTIIKMHRHALEGGTPGRSILVDGVYVNQQGQGFSGINPTGYSQVRVVNCHIVGVASPFYCVDMVDDPGATGRPSMRDIIISNNTFEQGDVTFTGAISGTTLTASAVTGRITPGMKLTASGLTANTTIVAQLTGTAYGAGTYSVSVSQTLSSTTFTPQYSSAVIRTQTIGSPSLIGRVIISNNTFNGSFYNAWIIGSNDAPSGIVANNDCSSMIGNVGAAFVTRTSNTGTAPAAGQVLLFCDNIFPPAMPPVNFTVNVPEWKNTRFIRINNNARGRTQTDATSSYNQYGSLSVKNAGWINAAVPANSISAVQTFTIDDATLGDRVDIFPAGTTWPIGPSTELIGYVSANNVVSVYVRNSTTSSSPTLGTSEYFFIELNRP